MRTEKVNKAKQSTDTHSRKSIKIIAIVIAVVGVLVLIDVYTPIWGGQVKFYTSWIRCGHQPLKDVRESYPVDSYIVAPTIDPFRNNRTNYFCTAKEAELSGLSSNSTSYDFPHLTQEEHERSRSILRENESAQ